MQIQVRVEPTAAGAPGGPPPPAAAAVLAFEDRRFTLAGAKEQAIRDTFGVTAVRYYQRLNTLLDDPAVFFAHPTVVTRLRGLRDAAFHRRHHDDGDRGTDDRP